MEVLVGVLFLIVAFGVVLGTNSVPLPDLCPCGIAEECPTLPPYGENRLDLEWFGVHRPCVYYGWVRCCPRNETTGLDLSLAGSDSLKTLYGPSRVLNSDTLTCTKRRQCQEAYGDKPTDVAVYGARHHCPKFGHVWCIKLKTMEESRPLNNSGPEEERSNSATSAEVELKSLPPRIYVDGSGTLVISGGSPVIYLPTAPTLQPVASTTIKFEEEPMTEPTVVTSPLPGVVPTGNAPDPVSSTEIGAVLKNVGDLVRFLLKKNGTTVTLDNGERKIQFGLTKNQALEIFEWIRGWKID